jgi:hypothetical protein
MSALPIPMIWGGSATAAQTIDRQINNATRATNGSPVLLKKRQIAIALVC